MRKELIFLPLHSHVRVLLYTATESNRGMQKVYYADKKILIRHDKEIGKTENKLCICKYVIVSIGKLHCIPGTMQLFFCLPLEV